VRSYGVDVNSGVEFPDGEKDPDRVRDFIALAKGCGLAPKSARIVAGKA
jgi:phosphoribosylanthranilate isomerase